MLSNKEFKKSGIVLLTFSIILSWSLEENVMTIKSSVNSEIHFNNRTLSPYTFARDYLKKRVMTT